MANDFSSFLMKTQRIRLEVMKIAQGTKVLGISKNRLDKIPLIIPTPPEQNKIATFLTAVDKRINLLQKKKAELEQYKKGILQLIMDNGKLKNKKSIRFKPSKVEIDELIENGKVELMENGEWKVENDCPVIFNSQLSIFNYKDWEEKNLGEVAEIKMGQSPDSTSYNLTNNGLPLIQGNADIINCFSSPRQYTNNPTKNCEIGDLILTVRAPVGAIAKSKHNACIGRGVCSIKNNNYSDLEYIYQFLLWYEPKWISLEQGSTFTAVSGKDIRNLKLVIPNSKSEQQKIANFLSSIDKSINNLQLTIDNSQLFKKGLLQKMFV